MKKLFVPAAAAAAAFIAFFSLITLFKATVAAATSPAVVSSPFLYTFNNDGDLFATTYMASSTSPYFWVSSGGRLVIRGGLGETMQGYAPTGDPSQVIYSRVNPLDTDDGHYPQNTFRLVSRNIWNNAAESIHIRITAQNLTDTPNRAGYSGIFLESRYTDKNNLYYAGIRDDGLAIIKKKIGGKYYTLAYVQVFGVVGTYDKYLNPSLLPLWQWMNMKVTTETRADGSVLIRLYLDRNDSGNWISMLKAVDKGVGGAPLTAAGHGGLRTDYMDVQFDDFRIENI